MAIRREDFPGTPEEMLPIEAPVQQAPVEDYDPKRQLPFYKVPNLLRQQPNPLITVTAEDVADIQPVALMRALHGPEGDRTVDRVALNAAEFGRIALSPKTLLARVQAPASVKYANSNPIVKEEHELNRRIDVAKQYIKKHDAVIEDLSKEIDVCKTLLGYAKYPHLRRATDVATRDMAITAWSGFANIIDVAAYQNGWSLDKKNAVNEAMVRALTTGAATAKLKAWRKTLPILQDYAARKRYIFSERNNELAEEQSKAQTKRDDLLARHGFTS